MYVALTKDRSFAFKHFLSGNRLRIWTKFSIWRSGSANIGIAKKMKEDKIKCLHLFQCFTEAGNDDMCHYVGNLLQDGTIDLSGQALSAIELYTLSSFLARCVHRHWDLLDLSHCFLDDENFERFYKSYSSLTKSTIYINTINLSSNAFTEVSASHIANLGLNFNVKNLVFSSNEIKDMRIDRATFAALLEYPNLVQSRFIEIQDENQVILVLYKKGLNISELFILCCCTIEAYKDICLYIKNNNSFFEMLINASSVSIFKTMLHSLINKMTLFSTNFKLYVKTINLTNEEINSIISSLASNVSLAVRIGERCLPLHLCNISNEMKDENEIFSSLGTILFYVKFSTLSMFSLFLGEKDLNQIYLNGITLYDSLIAYVSPKCMSLNSLQLVNCYVHDITIPNAVANMLSQVLCNTTFLEHLNLSGCRLKTEHIKIILEALKQVMGIITISLSDNNLANGVFDVLASVITCNRELQSIELSNCNLQEAAIVSITNALENCTDLQSLDLSNNVITDDVVHNVANLIKKHQSIKYLKLQSCQFHYEGIRKITEVMVKKTCLHCIDLSDNAISNQNAVLIASVIVNNTNLQKLNFSNCKLQIAGCQQVFQAIAKITSLVYLDLSSNLFTDVETDSFALMIYQNSGLEYLNISRCCDKPKDFEKVTGSLVTLKSLNYLDLSYNAINITSADNIATIISNNVFLEDLNLSRCEVRKSAFLKIIIALQNNHDLKYLYFNSNSVGYEEATGIAMVISNNPILETVNLSNSNLTEKEMKIILSSLRNHTLLKHFDISSNTITDHVVNEIADVIDSNTQLTYLNISDSDIQEYGILKIFKAAQRINTLKCIKMSNRTISDRAARDIADAISVNCMMEELVFTNNDFHETGIALVFGVLKKAHTLKSLTVASNKVITNITTKLTEVVSNNHMTYFDVSNCDLQKSSCSSILNSLILQSPILQHINFSDNNLSGIAETIAQLISVSYYLQYVNLANTLMQDEEVMIIIKAMQNINSLRYVDLMSYSINDELALELQNAVDENPAVISFQISKLCFKKIEVALMTLSKNIFHIVVNLQEISICFSDCENDQVDAAASLINNSPNLQYLYLENCSLLETDISDIIIVLSRTTTLQYFSLINIVITDKVDDGIAAILENNIQLKHFKLVACKVTEKEFTQCIQSFNITRLSHLVLSKMIIHITRQLKRPICDSLTHLNLSNVHLDMTKLSFLSLPSLTKLQYLNLSHNPLTDESASILSSVICSNHGLKHLDLCDCKLQSEGIRVIANSLQAINVVYLDMSLNTINIDTFNNNVIPVLFSSLSVVECLYLPYCKLKVKEIGKILDFISNAVHLKFIDFGPNTIPKDTISDFKNIIFVSKGNKQICFSTEGLKKVDFNNHETENLYHSFHYLNINNVIVSDEIANTVAALIAKSPKLEHLEMAGSEWNCTMTEIFCLLKECTALKVLELHNCCTLKDTISMTTEGPAFLHLNYLDLSNNYIDDEAVDYLAVLIATNVGLEYLNFRNCKLSFSGIQNISSALKVTSSLKFLDINFSDVEGKSLVEDQGTTLLANNRHLKQLRLSNLVLDNSMFHQIQSGLLVIKKLQRLTINNCIFTDKDTNTIISLVANNSTLHELTLHDCEMSMKSKIKFTYIATVLYMQCLKFDSITVTDIKHSPSASLHFKFNLTDNDVVAVMTVDNNLGELIMFKLMLNQNSLKVLSTNAVTVRHLKDLQIQDCIFTDYYAHYVAFLITNNATTIQSFSLTSCQMSMIQRMIITKALCKLNIILLQHLNIKDILYSNEEYEANKCLYSCFTITNCKLTDEIITAVMVSNKSMRISKLLINQSTLLELRKTLFVDQGNKKINFNADYVKTSKLERVNLNNHDTGHIFHSLHYLNISNIIVDDEVANTVANLIANSPELEHLEMVGGGWTFASAMKCFRAFQTTKKLIYLNLSNNCFTLTELLSLLTNFIALKFLHLRECGLKSTGIIPLTTLSTVTTLNYLDLSNNSIDDEAVDYLAVLIATNVGLEYLNFCNCKLSSSGIQNIRSALKVTSSLKFLDINFSDVEDQVATLLVNNKHLQELRLSNLVLDNSMFHLIQSHLLVIKGLQQLIINSCIFRDKDASTIISLIINNPTLCELCLLDCEMSVKCKIEFSCIATALYMQYLKFGTITFSDKYLLNANTLHCNTSKFNLTDDDVVAVMTVDNNLGEFTMFKLMLNQNSLKVLSTNTVTVRHLKVLHIQDCIFTDYYARYVAFLITSNATTIQSFSLTSCQMSMTQKIIIIIALCKLDIIFLQYLNIRDILHIDNETTANLKSSFTKINCKLTDDIVTAVVTDHTSLKISKLVINQNTLAELKRSMKLIKGVIHLTLNGYTFSDEDYNSVATVITNNDCIQELVLSNCIFLQKTFKGISVLQSLKFLSLDKITFPKSILLGTIASSTGLRYFTMSRCKITESELVNIMLSIVINLKHLLYINFSHVKCSCEVVQHITTVIHSNTKLKHINLCDCQLFTIGVKTIIQAAKNLTALEYLDLSCNHVTGYLANDIITLIANNKNIKKLSLPDYTLSINNNHLNVFLNTVTDLLVSDIATLITTNKNITELSLLDSNLNNDQLKIILNAIKECSSLPYVEFTINEISNVIENKIRVKFTKVIKMLVIQSMIMHQSHDLVNFRGLYHLGIFGCTFSVKEWNILEQLIAYNAALSTLILSDCQIYSGISEIVTICTRLSYLDLTNIKILV